MAFQLKINMKDGTTINQCYQNEEYALNLYALALVKKLANSAEIYDTTERYTILKFEE